MQSLGYIWLYLCWLYQFEPFHMNQKLYFSFPYPLSVFLPLFLIDLKYQTLRLCMGTCLVILLVPILVTLPLDLFISWMLLRGISLFHFTWLYLLTVQLFQHVQFFASMCSKPGINYIYNALMLRSFSALYSVILKPLVSYFLYFLKCFYKWCCYFWCQWFYQNKIVFSFLTV